MKIINKKDARWSEFCCKMISQSKPGNCNHKLSLTKKVLRSMGFNVKASLQYLEEQGGFCDCEVIMNICI